MHGKMMRSSALSRLLYHAFSVRRTDKGTHFQPSSEHLDDRRSFNCARSGCTAVMSRAAVRPSCLVAGNKMSAGRVFFSRTPAPSLAEGLKVHKDHNILTPASGPACKLKRDEDAGQDKMSIVTTTSTLTRCVSLHKLTSILPTATFCTNHRFTRAASSSTELLKTTLYDYHVAQGGKMVEFAGYSMPVQYKDGVLSSHLHCRGAVVLFDVSHMMQTSIVGKDASEFIESLTTSDVEALQPYSGGLTVFLTQQGTIIDDLIVNKLSGSSEFYVVSNAGCAEKDLALLKRQEQSFKDQGKDVTVTVLQKSLLALQGPQMTKLLQPLVSIDLSELPFMTTTVSDIGPFKQCRITRCGYTGEDGVEISVNHEDVVGLVELLTNSKDAECRLAGLAARDSLRLEAGLCLYGNDIDETRTPVEASLLWLISKRRRANADFPGAQIILEQIKNKSVAEKRVGFVVEGAPARPGAVLVNPGDGKQVGKITSGSPSPSLGKNVAMGYVQTGLSKVGTEVAVQIRNKTFPAVVTKMPFVPTNYFIKK